MFRLVQSIMFLGMTILMFGFVNISSNALHGAEIVYKWVDANGLEYYSDKPFEEAKKTKVALSSGKSPKDVSDESQTETSEDPFYATDTKRVSRECQNARDNLAAIESDTRLLSKDSEGNNVEMSADERAAQQEKNQDFWDTYCEDTSEPE